MDIPWSHELALFLRLLGSSPLTSAFFFTSRTSMRVPTCNGRCNLLLCQGWACKASSMVKHQEPGLRCNTASLHGQPA